MRFLRTVPTRRLLVLIWSLAIACAAGTAIAVAAAGNGPVPKPRPLAVAIHRAITAPSVAGVSARVTFTNNLVSSDLVQGTDPLLSGATGRLWATADHLRLELQSSLGDAQLVVDKNAVWAYDPAQDTVYEATLPADRTKSKTKVHEKPAAIPTVAQIQRELNRLASHLGISRAIPTDVGGRPAYRVVVSPKPAAGLIGDVQLAWDAARGLPLDFAIYARGSSTPALELKATNISYGRVSKSVFALKPPAGAKVVQLTSSSTKASATRPTRTYTYFSPAAPKHAGGLALTKRHLFAGGALLAYGKGLGGVYVLEHAGAKRTAALPTAPASGDGPGLMLPTLSVNGVTAQELPTALGTIIQFTRSGISYLVFGSVPPATAAAVARAL